MSSAEITLGAHLYTQAVDAGLPELFNSNPQDYGSIKLAFRDMAGWLRDNGCIAKDDAGNWQPSDKGMDALTEDQEKAFLPYYETAVMAHQKARGDLTRDGKAEYINDFQDIHADKIIEIEPATVTRVRADDMQTITTSSLNLLQAVHDDPANAAFVPGLDKASMDSMWNILEKSGYLMPGENPDRQSALGDQPLRGTPEEQDALYHQASQIAANVDLPDVINQGDKPMGAAMMLKGAVESANVEQVEAGIGTMENGWDSDLMSSDCNSIYNVVTTFARVAHSAQWDTQSLDSLLADPRKVDDLRVALADYDDKGIQHALMSGNMGDPKMTPDAAERFGQGIEWMKEAVNTDMKSERMSGDEGGMMTQGGASKASSRDFEEELGGAETEGDMVDAEDSAATDTGRGTAAAPIAFDADADLASDVYGRSDRKVRIPEAMVYQADMIVLEMLDNGTVEYLRQRAGRAEANMGDIESSKAAFGSLEEAMGQYRENFGESRGGHNPAVFTTSELASKNPESRDRLRTAKIEEGRGPFKTYKTGSADVSAKRLTRWLDENMLVTDAETGKSAPNYDLRRFLRDATQMPVEAKNRPEGEALRAYAEKFVERDRKEVEDRREEDRVEKRGVSKFEFTSEEIGRFIQVKEAAASGGQVRLSFDKDGSATLSDPDAPKLKSNDGKVADKLSDALGRQKEGAREFGGMISTEQLKAAYQTGADKISILVDGETPYSAVGKLQDDKVRTKTKSQDIVLS